MYKTIKFIGGAESFPATTNEDQSQATATVPAGIYFILTDALKNFQIVLYGITAFLKGFW